MTNAEREARLFEIDDASFPTQASIAIGALLAEGDQPDAERVVRRIRDERGVAAIREIAKDCGYGNPLGSAVVKLARLPIDVENKILQAVIVESTELAALTNKPPSVELRARLDAREAGWQNVRRRSMPWRLTHPPVIASCTSTRGRSSRTARPRSSRRASVASSPGPPGRPARQSDDDDPPLVRRLSRVLVRLFGGGR